MSFDKENCPYCGYEDCEADWVDNGIGYQQCQPYYCENCGAYEIGPYDDVGFDKNKLLNEHHKKYLKQIKTEDGSLKYEFTKEFKIPSYAKITQEEWDKGWYKPTKLK